MLQLSCYMQKLLPVFSPAIKRRIGEVRLHGKRHSGQYAFAHGMRLRIFSPRLPREHRKLSPAGPSKTRRTGIDPKWHDDFPWVLPTEDRDGMLCSLCRKHCRRPRKSIVGKAVWTDEPRRMITRQALVKHGQRPRAVGTGPTDPAIA